MRCRQDSFFFSKTRPPSLATNLGKSRLINFSPALTMSQDRWEFEVMMMLRDFKNDLTEPELLEQVSLAFEGIAPLRATGFFWFGELKHGHTSE